MKKVKLFSFALAALMLGACSSEDVIDNGGQTVLPGEKGYISLGINLPTTPSTRATTNDNFADGTQDEYAVNNAALLIFEGTDEEHAIFTGGYDLVNLNGNSVGGNITSQYKVTTSITKPTQGDIYALVVVNRGDVLAEEDGTWTLKGTPLTSTTTLASFNEVAQTISASDLASTDKGFFMTNAPLYSVPGGELSQAPNGKLSTLTLINAENVYSTEAEAKANPAASVYVERAVAKVSVVNNTPDEDVIDANPTGLTTRAFTFEGWAFDVTNTKTYLVRNMSAAANWWAYNVNNNYRFVGSSAVGPDLFRTYWGVDPNYSNYISADFTKINGTAPTGEALTPMYTTENHAAGYCLENTFNVANQNQAQTTRVIVAAQLNGGNTFYILDNDKGTVYDETAAEDAIKAEYLGNQKVTALLKQYLNGSLTKNDLTVTFDDTKTAGVLTVKSIEISDEAQKRFTTFPEDLETGTDANKTILDEVNAAKKVSCYKNGIAYYPVMIQHFGQDLTPWSDQKTGESYPEPNAENNWLGRYGVLRNNWYEINVNGISNIGYAEVPEVYNTPDDPVNSYISVDINILSWAKRTQEVEL